jgi:DedD protein
MASSQDTEITLGTGKLLFLFFGLVAVCAVFFALGYSLGRKSEPAITTASAAVNPEPASAKKNGTASTPAPQMTFYKNVEQKEASPDLTVPADKKNDTATATAAPTPGPAATGVDPSTTIPNSAYFVQVAAVSKQDDADALVDALKKKEYPAFVAANSSTDKLFRVQLGPFGDIKDAEAMRTKLVGDGYSPIVKK